jgi:hypothetical protein
MVKPALKAVPSTKLLKLDLGAGKGLATPEGFTPVDIVPIKYNAKQAFAYTADLTKPWPWKANSVDEVHCAMLIHYFTPDQRRHFFNELHRVLKAGSQARIITPMWSSHRAYIDLRAVWPPVSEGFYHTLNAEWRKQQNDASDMGLRCDFDIAAGYGLHPAIVTRNQDYQQNAVQWSKEAAQDLIACLTARK